MRKYGKIDANQPGTVDLLRSSGWSVHITSSLGGGFPDLVCARGGFTAVVELKNLEGKGMRLSLDEQAFSNVWKGVYIIATSPADALRQLESCREVAA